MLKIILYFIYSHKLICSLIKISLKFYRICLFKNEINYDVFVKNILWLLSGKRKNLTKKKNPIQRTTTSINIKWQIRFPLFQPVENAGYLRSSWYVLLDVIESGGRDKTSEGTASHKAVQNFYVTHRLDQGRRRRRRLAARYTSWEKHVECDWLFQVFFLLFYRPRYLYFRKATSAHLYFASTAKRFLAMIYRSKFYR